MLTLQITRAFEMVQGAQRFFDSEPLSILLRMLAHDLMEIAEKWTRTPPNNLSMATVTTLMRRIGKEMEVLCPHGRKDDDEKVIAILGYISRLEGLKKNA
jgi:hypothetical protein